MPEHPAPKAALMNLLSIGAAYGVVALFAEGGAVGGLIGIDGEVRVAPFIPVMVFAILFGLSMDYEVFVLSRVREEVLRHATRRAPCGMGWPRPPGSSPPPRRSWWRSSWPSSRRPRASSSCPEWAWRRPS
ncbi:MAG: MMPL family transporter, partial [Actinomycetota bacterium]|nr:MMPL family transporter [Actinomycetota bacterium]